MDVLAVLSRTKLIQFGLQLIVFLNLTSYLWPRDTPIHEISCYDYIIVGGGTAGSILANRLTEDGNYQVLLIEAGGDPPIESIYPSTFSYLPNSKYDWNFTTINDGCTAQEHKQKILELTSGKMLGGSSSLGHLLYMRGDPHDYNSWAKVVRDRAWNYENLLPYFKKLEHHVGKENVGAQNDGYIGLTKQRHKISQKYLKAFNEIGHNILTDANGVHTLGYFEPIFMIKDGFRQSTAYAYLTPAKHRSNLHVLKETEVIKINFKGNTTVGVTVVKNGEKITITAKKEVIVSAGAIKSPQLLMLSGIGPKDHLNINEIPVKSNLPVGRNYHDHLSVTLVHKLNIKHKKLLPDNPLNFPFPIVVGNAAVQKAQTYPDYQTINYILPSASDSIISLCSASTFNDDLCQSLYDATKGSETVFTKLVLLNPKSRGHVVLAEKNYTDPPMIISRFFTHEEDIDSLIDYIQDFIQVAKTTVFKHFDAEFVHPNLTECKYIRPVGSNYWKCYVLGMMGTNYQYSGTCSMGTVVDSRLRVFGVNGLRVVDSSVIPLVTSGGTQAAVMAIAEKGAEMILEDSRDRNV